MITPIVVEASNHSIEIYFEESDFEFVTNSEKQVQIRVGLTSTKEYWFAGEDSPAFPVFSYDYGIFGKCNFKGIKVVNKDTHVVATGVGISKAIPYVPTSMQNTSQTNTLIDYYNSEYQENSPVSYNGSSCWNNLTIFHFTICPFEYDAETSSLYFTSHMSIQLEVSDIVARQMQLGNFPEYGIHTISNFNVNCKSIFETNLINVYNEKLDYLIVTNEELKGEFAPLLKWKKRKGLSTQIITTEEISRLYPDKTIQLPLKIKKYLYEKYINNHLEYVLLGGDDTVVPVLKCYCKANYREQNDMPVDLFYSCFGGSFNWDGNKNGRYGEPDDSVVLASSIFVSRIPVRNREYTSQYIKKLLDYELSPRWRDNILMAGQQLSVVFKTGQSDAEAQAVKLYDSIRPLWNGKRFRLFDTVSDFGDIRFSKEGLKNQISNGYSYIDIITHGSQTSWKIDDGDYVCQDGNGQVNVGHSIILTSSCKTNAFDCTDNNPNTEFYNDPCLSESLIRNYNSGVLAYWGSSRENWTNGWDNGTLDPSLVMEVPFYKGLFGNQIENKNFAKLIAFAKLCNVGKAYADPTYRWLQYSLNPIGDPEMCLYTTVPNKLDNIQCSYTENSVIFDTGVADCRICIMSEHDEGLSYFKVFDHIKTVEISDLPDCVSICVTKQNYIPKQITITHLHDITLSSDTHIVSDIVRIGKSANPTEKIGDVNIVSGNIIIDAPEIEIGGGVNISKGASVVFNHK